MSHLFESKAEFKEYACDAIGFPIIAYDDYKNDVERDAIQESGKCLRPWIFEASKTLVTLLDISNTVLDYILVVNLILMGEYKYAALLGFMTSLTCLVSAWMKFLMYQMRKDTIQPEFILQFVLATELFIFAFEDATTILILSRVDEAGEFLVDHSEIFGASLNLWTTILSGLCVGLLLIIHILLMHFEIAQDERSRWRDVICWTFPSIAAMFYISYMLYFAIDKILLENPITDGEELNLKDVYIFVNIVMFVVILVSNLMVSMIAIYGGGGN